MGEHEARLSAQDFARLLAEARARSQDAKEKILIGYQEMFRKWASQRIGQESSILHDSDVTQQVFMTAWRHFEQFRGDTQEELDAWMRKVFDNEWNSMFRHWHREKRDVFPGGSLGAGLV